MEMLNIGEAARACGVSADTLRHYERVGVLVAPERTSSGYRRYPLQTVERVRIIRRALAIGFTLRELGELFAVRNRGGVPCRRAFSIVEKRLEEVDATIEGLIAARDTMRGILADWRERIEGTDPSRRAGLLDSLTQ